MCIIHIVYLIMWNRRILKYSLFTTSMSRNDMTCSASFMTCPKNSSNGCNQILLFCIFSDKFSWTILLCCVFRKKWIIIVAYSPFSWLSFFQHICTILLIHSITSTDSRQFTSWNVGVIHVHCYREIWQ